MYKFLIIASVLTIPLFLAYCTKSEDREYEQVKKFVLLPRLFTIQDGEITPTLKLKRKQIYAKHEKEILALYIS